MTGLNIQKLNVSSILYFTSMEEKVRLESVLLKYREKIATRMELSSGKRK
jgi:hypothetical protein